MCIFIKILNFTSRNLLTYLKKWGIIIVMSDEITNKILHLYTYGKKDELKTLRNQLLVEQAKIEKFLSKFLDMFERKMSYEKVDTPVWKLYRSKMSEYSKLETLVNTANYYVAKNV